MMVPPELVSSAASPLAKRDSGRAEVGILAGTPARTGGPDKQFTTF